jgi:cyanophycinase
VPTASAPEGDAVFDGWASKGRAHYARLGVPAQVAPIRTRADADDSDVVAMAEEASVVFFSGGNPYALAEAMRGSSFWGRLVERLRDGLPFAGCSAGVAFLTERTYDTAVAQLADELWKPGVGEITGFVFAPHWDTADGWVPGMTAFIAASLRPGETLIAIDENTAMMGDGVDWRVVGLGGVHVLDRGAWQRHAAGGSFVQDLQR